MSENNEWRSRLRLLLEDFVDEFVAEGADHREVLDAVASEVVALRDALDRDPDPAEEAEDGEAVNEPANDWPSA
jgi:hypothetical protein